MSQSDGRDVAMSLNVACVKVGEPRVDPESLFAALASNPTGDFLAEAATTRVDQGLAVPSKASAPRLYQQIHMQLIESRQRARHLAEKLREMETAVARKAPARKKAPRAAKPE
jgi:hypothetical protein